MKKILVGILAIVFVATGAMFIFAQQDGGQDGRRGFGKRGGHHRGGFRGMMLRGLDLTGEQKAQVKQIMEASRAKIGPIRESLKANRQKLQELTAAGAFDEAQVAALANNQGALQAQMIVEKERAKSQVFQILTDEQKAKAAQMKEQMKERFKNRMEKRGAEKEAPGDE